MKYLLAAIDKFELYLESAALWGFTIAAFAQVVCRYVFNNALPWPEELGRYLLVCVVFLGISTVMRTNGHLRVEVITVWLSRKSAMFLNLLSSVIIGVFCIYAAWLSVQMTMLIYEMEQTTQSFDFPAWITWLPMPIGFCLTCIQLVRYEYDAWMKFRQA